MNFWVLYLQFPGYSRILGVKNLTVIIEHPTGLIVNEIDAQIMLSAIIGNRMQLPAIATICGRDDRVIVANRPPDLAIHKMNRPEILFCPAMLDLPRVAAIVRVYDLAAIANGPAIILIREKNGMVVTIALG